MSAENTILPAVGVSMTTMAGSGKDSNNIVIQTHFPAELSEEQMDMLLDRYAGRLARQRQIGAIPEIMESIDRCKKAIDQISTDTDRIDRQQQADWEKNGRTGSVRLSEANKKQREEASLNLAEWKRRLAAEEKKMESALAALNSYNNAKPARAAKTA